MAPPDFSIYNQTDFSFASNGTNKTDDCDKFTSIFTVFYSVDFFLMFMIQIIFLTCAIQIMTILPERVNRYKEGVIDHVHHKKRT